MCHFSMLISRSFVKQFVLYRFSIVCILYLVNISGIARAVSQNAYYICCTLFLNMNCYGERVALVLMQKGDREKSRRILLQLLRQSGQCDGEGNWFLLSIALFQASLRVSFGNPVQLCCSSKLACILPLHLFDPYIPDLTVPYLQ